MRREHEKAEEQPVLDLYDFDYHQTMLRERPQQAPLRQIGSIAATLLANSPNLVAAFTKRSQRRDQKLQLALGVVCVMILVLYVLVLAASLVGTVTAFAGNHLIPQPGAAGSPAPDASTVYAGHPIIQWLVAHEHLLGMFNSGIVVFTFGAYVVRFDVKALLAQAAPQVAYLSDYLSVGMHRNAIVGSLLRRLDHLDQQTEVQYRKVHIIAYSFGSVIALDTLFSQETAPGKSVARVDTLVTIGCPFDFVRTYWPTYFQGRNALPNIPRRWVNVYSYADVLGSNFLDELPTADKPTGIKTNIAAESPRRPNDADNISFGPRQEDVAKFWERVRFIGFRSHRMYWDGEEENAVACFGPIVEKLYPGGAT